VHDLHTSCLAHIGFSASICCTSLTASHTTHAAAGAHLGYEYSGKLFAVTYLIVAPAGFKEGSGLFVAVSRAGGILAGILLTLLLSCSWFPRSASAQVGVSVTRALRFMVFERLRCCS
jgi:hypothetical protein